MIGYSKAHSEIDLTKKKEIMTNEYIRIQFISLSFNIP